MIDFLNHIDPKTYTIILIVLIIIGTIIINRVLLWLMNKSFDVASEKLISDPTRFRFLKNATTLIVWLVALATITMLIPKLKHLALAMFAGAGVFLAIIGFAAQQAFSNIISGVFIVIFKPFRVGDLIRVNDYFGVVEDITLRHTIILDFENKRIIIPNSVISAETVINSNIEDEKVCEFVVIGVSYDSNLDLAMKIMREHAERHPNCLDNRTEEEIENNEPKVYVAVIGFGDSSVNLRASIWAKDYLTARGMHYDLNKSIKEDFDKQGIEIPFPYRTIVYKDKK